MTARGGYRVPERTPDGRRESRTKHGIPAVVAALALAGAGMLATASPAAAEDVPAPAVAPQQSGAPAPAELAARVAGTLEGIRAAERAGDSTRPAPEAESSGPSARIIGGKTTTIASAPWMAQLYFGDSLGNSYSCGGTVVAPTKILTAAHCVEGISWKSTGAVVTGATRVPTDTGRTDADGNPIVDFHGGEVRGVYRQWHHSKYDSYSFDADVAVLTLTSPVKAKPLPIMKSSDTKLYKAGTDGKVYGWGRIGSSPTAPGSDRLKVADADARSDADCRKAYGADFIAGTMYCAGRAPTGKDSTTETTCNGDSGGPLVAGGRLVGVVSWGHVDCSKKGKYGVYAKVSAFQSDIRARVHDTNLSGHDHYADLLARKGDTLYGWVSSAKGTKLTRKYDLGDFSGVNLLVQADLNRDDSQDLIFRVTNGDVYWAHGETGPKRIGAGWGSHRQILVPGDLTGDDIPDLMTVEAKGKAYVYPGKGNGSFGARVSAGSGWDRFSMVRGHGDFTGDGKADVLSRAAGGKIYLHKGTGSTKAPFSARTLVGTYSTLNALVTTGDVNGDGRADLLARDSKNKLWLYPGSGKASKLFGSRVQLGGDWKSYNLFG
ncbi:trypsin-like serine protease [Streptomyces katsurahamanus]|uniref:Trypsin-like serine protease n=1 Tax=Streptomyces katsurahamanus TaxID=2577098 RepID=A0ABW9NVZ5_9ACTN|nr:trypsin-like serine protease [Streptomyces katsurahamanus]